LWNDTHSYFRAYTGGDAIMGDCLYGAMVAHHHGLGWVVDVDRIRAHLDAEVRYNGDDFGIKVMTGRHEPPPTVASSPASPSARVAQGWARMVQLGAQLGVDTQDDVVWLGAAPDWSYLALTAQPTPDITAALAPTARQLQHYRDGLRDVWNIVGITAPGDWPGDMAGMPYVTSHYGFVMTDYYLLPALSGQHTDLPRGLLTFAPLYTCPFEVSVLLARVTGTLRCANSKYTLTVHFGELTLPAGGLAVNGRAYGSAVHLTAGQAVTW
jgi:hypothetical protein